MSRPRVLVFDVNETLSDVTALSARFVEVGAPGTLAATWFAQVLRDGFALAATGSTAPFREIGAALLHPLLAAEDLDRPVDEAVEVVLDALATLPLHPDVVPGIRALADDGHRLVVLTNGAASVPERLFAGTGIRDAFEALLSAEDAGVWKPGSGAYLHAARACGVTPQDMALVAVHPWDIHGAAHAGLQTVWINRDEQAYPEHCTPPDRVVTGVVDLAAVLAGG